MRKLLIIIIIRSVFYPISDFHILRTVTAPLKTNIVVVVIITSFLSVFLICFGKSKTFTPKLIKVIICFVFVIDYQQELISIISYQLKERSKKEG